MIYDVVMYFVNNGSRIMGLVNAILDGVGAIASGSLAGAAKLVEDSLAKALPMAISFLASLVGLGGLGEKIKEILLKGPHPRNKAITAILKPLVTPLKKLWAKGKAWVKKKVAKAKAWINKKVRNRSRRGPRRSTKQERLGSRRNTRGSRLRSRAHWASRTSPRTLRRKRRRTPATRKRGYRQLLLRPIKSSSREDRG